MLVFMAAAQAMLLRQCPTPRRPLTPTVMKSHVASVIGARALSHLPRRDQARARFHNPAVIRTISTTHPHTNLSSLAHSPSSVHLVCEHYLSSLYLATVQAPVLALLLGHPWPPHKPHPSRRHLTPAPQHQAAQSSSATRPQATPLPTCFAFQTSTRAVISAYTLFLPLARTTSAWP